MSTRSVAFRSYGKRGVPVGPRPDPPKEIIERAREILKVASPENVAAISQRLMALTGDPDSDIALKAIQVFFKTMFDAIQMSPDMDRPMAATAGKGGEMPREFMYWMQGAYEKWKTDQKEVVVEKNEAKPPDDGSKA